MGVPETRRDISGPPMPRPCWSCYYLSVLMDKEGTVTRPGKKREQVRAGPGLRGQGAPVWEQSPLEAPHGDVSTLILLSDHPLIFCWVSYWLNPWLSAHCSDLRLRGEGEGRDPSASVTM